MQTWTSQRPQQPIITSGSGGHLSEAAAAFEMGSKQPRARLYL